MYQAFIQITKYGFGSILLLASIYTFYISYKEARSYKFLFRWFSLTGYALLATGLILVFVTSYTNQDDSLILIRAISTAFALIYGIYATLTGFHETDPETGRKILTKFGILGVMILCFNTVFSTALDYTKAALEVESRAVDEKERKEQYQKLIGSMGFMDQRAGTLQFNFQMFSENLYKTLISTEKELDAKKSDLATRDAELRETRNRLAEADTDRKALRERIEKSEAALASKETELKARESELRARDADLKARDADLRARDADLKNANALSASLSDTLKKSQEDVARLNKEVSSRDGEIKDLARKNAELDALYKQSQIDLKKAETVVSSKEMELVDFRVRLATVDALYKKEMEERARVERALAAKEIELRACKIPVVETVKPETK